MNKIKPNYYKLLPYLLNQEFDESYALLSHYVQSNGNAETNEYRKQLIEHGVDVKKLPLSDDFNKIFNIPFPSVGTNFTFIQSSAEYPHF